MSSPKQQSGEVDPALQDLLLELENVDRALSSLRMSGAFNQEDVLSLQRILHRVELRRIEGVFVPPHFKEEALGGRVPKEMLKGQAVLNSLLHRCRRTAHLLLTSCESVSPALRSLFVNLVELHRELQRLGEDDEWRNDKWRLIDLQDRLRSLDAEFRREAFSFFEEGAEELVQRHQEAELPQRLSKMPKAGQAVLHDVLNACYQLIDEIVGREEPMPDQEKLFTHIINELEQLEARLKSMKKKSNFTVHDLKQISSQLDEAENRANTIQKDLVEKQKGMEPRIESIKQAEKTATMKRAELLRAPCQVRCIVSRCHRQLHMLYSRTEVDQELGPLDEKLEKWADQLHEFEAPFRKAIKEADHGTVAAIQKQVEKIGEEVRQLETKHRKGGVFVSKPLKEHEMRDVQKVPSEIAPGQAVLHDLLNECYYSLRKFEMVEGA